MSNGMTAQPEPAATQREVDILRDEVHRLDDHGTRGVGALQAQLTDAIKDIVELRADMVARFEAHSRVHEQDKRDRASGRRWLIGTGIAGVAAMAAVFAALLDILSHIHG